ncbi:MAG: hypothetical protein ABII00_07615 [Elusimicrobiota bacterium]
MSLFLWDNWVSPFAKDGLLHRFSLAAPKTVEPEKRHALAAIHHWTSSDAGTWSGRGPAIAAGPTGSFDDGTVWSGSAVDDGGRLALFYTGLRAGPGKRQSIGVAFSEDGRAFRKHGSPVLEPAAGPGYDPAGDADVPMAWRDPHVFRDPGTGRWHMLFSARREGAEPKGCVGHAASADASLNRWRLLPPLALPRAYLQMEMPSILFRDGEAYCFCSTTDAPDADRPDANASVRVYKAPGLEGPWSPAGPGGGDLLLGPESGIYAASVFRLPGRKAEARAVGFYTAAHARPYTWTPLLPVRWSGRTTVLVI